jgi:hypothetical protein
MRSELHCRLLVVLLLLLLLLGKAAVDDADGCCCSRVDALWLGLVWPAQSAAAYTAGMKQHQSKLQVAWLTTHICHSVCSTNTCCQ